MSDSASEVREVRGCDSCNQQDDHPRHIIYAVVRHPVTQEAVDLSIAKHIDCCAADGCEICTTDLEFTGGRHGLELATYMVTKSAEHHQALFERHGVESINFQKEAD